MNLVLASASPRRAEILTAFGLSFEIKPSAIKEEIRLGEDAVAAAQRLARAKAEDVGRNTAATVLAADTLVFIGAEIFGKPIDTADARRMLGVLAGRTHSVVTGVALQSGGILWERAVVSRVRFAPMTADEIAWYVTTGEPMDKAGAYAIQGAGSRFVEAIEGSPSNVIGLPVRAVYELFQDAGLPNLALPLFGGRRK